MAQAKLGIAVEFEALINAICNAMLCMTKVDRIIFADRALNYAISALSDFQMAYDCPDRRAEYTDVFISEYKQCNNICRIMIKRGCIRITHRENNTTLRPETIIQAMFDIFVRIDSQLGAWRGSVVRNTNQSI